MVLRHDGVLADHHDAGLGYRLKSAQRDAARAAGIDHIVWTYDPLQSGNARFNLGRLAEASRPPLGQAVAWAVTATGPSLPSLPGPPNLEIEGAQMMVFLHYFARGYAATDASRIPDPQRPRVAYLLERTGPHPACGPA